MFESVRFRCAARFALWMKPEIRDDLRQMLEAIAARGQADEELKIHRVMELFVEPVILFEYPASKERRCRWNVKNLVVKQDECTEFNLTSYLERLA